MRLFFIILTVVTTYTHSTYQSVCTKEVNTSAEQVNEVVDQFVYDMQTDITRLFTWAFLNTNDEGDAERDAIGLRYKETYYDPETHYGKLIVDVVVPGVHTFKNMTIETTLTDTVIDGSRVARLDIDYSGSLLKTAFGTFTVTPVSDNQCTLTLNMNVRFGFFANLFVTRRVYRNVIEWRLDTIVENLKEKAETGKVSIRPRPEL